MITRKYAAAKPGSISTVDEVASRIPSSPVDVKQFDARIPDVAGRRCRGATFWLQREGSVNSGLYLKGRWSSNGESVGAIRLGIPLETEGQTIPGVEIFSTPEVEYDDDEKSLIFVYANDQESSGEILLSCDWPDFHVLHWSIYDGASGIIVPGAHVNGVWLHADTPGGYLYSS